jgi:hypothetical protein
MTWEKMQRGTSPLPCPSETAQSLSAFYCDFEFSGTSEVLTRCSPSGGEHRVPDLRSAVPDMRSRTESELFHPMDQPDSRDGARSVLELLEAQHWSEARLDVVVILLNDIGEQDRGVKRRLRPMLGLKNFGRAITIAGVELLHRIRKDQCALSRLRVRGGSTPAIWNAELAA